VFESLTTKKSAFLFHNYNILHPHRNSLYLILMDPCIVDYSVQNTNKMQLSNGIY